jgi:hypothetical protein
MRHFSTLVATLLAFLGVALAAAAHDPAADLTPARTIPLPHVSGRIDHLAYDAKSERLFIAALGNGSLEVVDLAKGAHVRSIPKLKEPQGVAIAPPLRRVLAACGGDGSLRSFDCDTLDEKGTLALGDDADNARATPDAAAVLVGFGSGGLAIVDPASLKKTSTVPLPGHPESFQLDPASPRVFVNVPGGLVGGGGAVVVADRTTGATLHTWKLAEAGRNFPMALDAKNNRLYVGCRRPARLLVLDASTGAVVASPECVGDADDIFVDPASGHVIVIGGDGAIDVFASTDFKEYRRTSTIKTASGARTGLLIPERHALYVAVPASGSRAAEIREFTLPHDAPEPLPHR